MKSNRKKGARYVLRRGLGFWELTYAGRRVVLKHEQGLFYVAWLLLDPPEQPLHGMALALKASAAFAITPRASSMLSDPTNGQAVPVAREATVQEYDLGLDDAKAAAALRRKQRELEALLDDPAQCEVAKAEAVRELEQIYRYQQEDPGRLDRTAKKCVRTVRMAIRRFHQHLAASLTASGKPHPVSRAFAQHLEEFLLVPSARFSGRRGARARVGIAGRFTYEPPPGVRWTA